ncbi:MAG: gliding motility-associated C-terminal domain-containing protein [Saprospiraceae bacterium]
MKPNFPRQKISIFVIILNLFCFFSNISFANIDSIYTSIPDGQFGTSCVDINNFPGTIESITNLCPSLSGVYANFSIPPNVSSGCINYFGLEVGESHGCFKICDDQSNCDTVHIFLNTVFTPLSFACDTLISPEIINASISDCGAMAAICLPISFDVYNSLEINDNGILYANGATGCNMDTTVAYSYNNLFGQGGIGPYELESWTINGVEYSGAFADMQSLLDSMNLWDTLGVWEFDTIVPFTILGGFSDNFYGPLIASKPGVINSTSIMGANFSLTPMGSEIMLLQGSHLITLVDTATACIDSVLITVACLQNDYLSLTTYLNISGSICVDTSDLIGNFATVENVCNDTGIGLDIFPNDVCIDWETLEEGPQQICLMTCDDQGFCDTTFISFVVIDPQNDTIDVIMTEDDSQYFCIDSTDLFGDINNYTISQAPTLTTLTLDTIDFCLEITSTTPGSEMACVVICDNQGGCDTTCFNIVVEDSSVGLPVAIDDADTTAFGTPFIIDFLANDSFGLTDTISIVATATPQNGILSLDSLGNYTYTPDEGSCGNDNFSYQICNAVGCVQATVSIYVQCEEVIVFSGFSPNRDDVNDFFTVRGLEGHPNNQVRVYNRWGNLIFNQQNYQNNWDGTWNGGRVPQGTYFYMIELNDPSKTKLSGSVYIAY